MGHTLREPGGEQEVMLRSHRGEERVLGVLSTLIFLSNERVRLREEEKEIYTNT